MEIALTASEHAAEQDVRIAETVRREQGRLRNFIRRRVDDEGDAEGILQDVFAELVEAVRLMQPIEQVGAWLYRVARNRIIGRFRRSMRAPALAGGVDEDERAPLRDLLPSPGDSPEAAYARGVLLDELEAAIDELPADQRAAFIGHEIHDRPFAELAAEAGVSVNAMVLRKHHAVLRLRERLADIHAEFADGRRPT